VRIRGADPGLAPAIRANFLHDTDDVRVMLAGLQWVRRLAATPAFTRIVHTEREPGPECRDAAQLVEFLRAKSSTVFHPTGTCRMGRDALAVVDHELRVHGVYGLRVVDASIMPAVTSGNTNAPTIMIAERAADFVLQASQVQLVSPAASGY
jgi:choline dehydrogenase-like flavoprotein